MLTAQGRVVALDKSKNKTTKLEENIRRWSCDCVEVYHFDATKSLDLTAGISTFLHFIIIIIIIIIIIYLLEMVINNS